MKPRLMVALLITGLLLISAEAEESSRTNATNTAIAGSLSQPNSSVTHTAQREVPVGTREMKENPQQSDKAQGTIVVDVWSSATSVPAPETESDRLSSGFSRAALTAAFRMRSTERTLEQSIRKGFPLGEFWIQAELDLIAESLSLAALSASNDTDWQALQALESQNARLRLWTDWLIDANRNLRLANYYMSASALNSDEQFQSNVACTNFLVSMLASRTFAENYSCR